jgi:hypothetical protein
MQHAPETMRATPSAKTFLAPPTVFTAFDSMMELLS